MGKPKTPPHVLPVTIRDHRKQREEEKMISLFSFLATCLLFTGFLMVLVSVKTVWDLKIENWRLVKENAALKKTVRENVSVEKFKQQIPTEDEIVQFERPANIEDPDLSWSVSIQIFWSSPFITPCNMNWLARELAEQIYERKTELDQEKKQSGSEFKKELVDEMFDKENKLSPNIEEVFDIATVDQEKKIPDNSKSENPVLILEEEFVSEDDDDASRKITKAPLTSDLYFGEEYEIIAAYNSYDEKTKNELKDIFDEMGYDLNVDLKLDMERDI